MSAGDIAALIAAVAFVALVGGLAVPLLKLGRLLDHASSVVADAGALVRGVTAETTPLLHDLDATVITTNAQLARVDTITSNVEQVTTNVSAMTSLLASTMGNPVIKVAAFSYGVRTALRDRDKARDKARARGRARADRAERKADRKSLGDGPARAGSGT